MIPRIHRRGNSFKGALGYVLHDPGKESSERVAWVLTQNIFSEPENAWFEMFDTYRSRTALKQNAGIDPRGRDNKTPVLHYTLAWHATDTPDPEHMKAMALDSLKALGLSEHEAVIACHSDKEHHHVHVVVNTVHPYTGKTAALKFSKLEFSRWAEAYEKEHGIHCEERIKNNDRRREIADRRKAEREQAASALLSGKVPPEPAPFEPVNDNSPNRRRWFERKEVVDKMKALRAALDQQHKDERGGTWARHSQARDEMERKTHAALDELRASIKQKHKPKWRDLYQHQKREERQIGDVATHPLERAVYLFRNRERLGDGNRPLSIRRMIPLILSNKKLKARVEQIHMRERRALARQEKTETKHYVDQMWQVHRAAFHTLRDQQAAERGAERAHQQIERKDITFTRAKAELTREDDQLAKAPTVPKGPWRQSYQARGTPEKQGGARTVLSPPASPSAGSIPLVPKKARVKEDAKTVLMRGQQTPSRGTPSAPIQPPAPTVPQRNTGRTSTSFTNAATPGTPAVQKDFNQAASTDLQKKAQEEKIRQEQMRKDMEKWKRRGARDDFERER